MSPAFVSRQERFDVVGSTNDVVRGWLDDGTPEVCLAVADEQTVGRGRAGRTWQAPPGTSLLLSLGLRPTWLAPEQVWRIPATVSLAMADAAEEAGSLPDGMIRLKWPNDLVIESSGEWLAGASSSGEWLAGASSSGEWLAGGSSSDEWLAGASPSTSEGRVAVPGSNVRKLGGVLGESDGLGNDDPKVIVGIGVNAGWPRADFPPDLAPSMTSLFDASGGRPVDLALLLDAFLGRLEVRIELLRDGRFDVADWTSRQLTTGRVIEIERPDGTREVVRAVGVDSRSGALLVEDEAGDRQVHVGDIRHVRLPAAAGLGV